jgi:non-specific protein-tyrosine kinase
MSTLNPLQQGQVPDSDDTLDLREYLRPIWNRKWLILLVVLLGAGGAYALGKHNAAKRVKVSYYSQSQVNIEVYDPTSLVGNSQINPNYGTSQPDSEQMQTLASLFTDESSLRAIYANLHMSQGTAGTLSASPDTSGQAQLYGSSVLDVSATSPTPKLAERLVNTAVSTFLATRAAAFKAEAQSLVAQTSRQISSLRQTSGNEDTIAQLQLQRFDLDEQVASPNPEATQLLPASRATAVGGSHGRSPKADAVIGAVVGLLLGIAIAFITSLFDRRLRRVSAVESSYGHDVLAVLPHVGDAAPAKDGRVEISGPLLEALRALRINLRLSTDKGGPRTLLVTSAVPGEGKSTVARNLALVYADAGERVLLIDADLRRPSVPRMFGLAEDRAGLSNVLSGTISPGNAVVRVISGSGPKPSSNGSPAENGSFSQPIDAPGEGSLDILTHGEVTDNPVVLFSSPAIGHLLRSALEPYDIVIIDSAPLLAVTDTVPLMSEVDGVLLVARLGVTTRDAASRLTEVISRVPGAHVVGVVANDMRDGFLDAGYGGVYSGYKGYGYRSSSHAGKKLVGKAG